MLGSLAYLLLASQRSEITLDVAGEPRQAIVYAASVGKPSPVLFVFHGHGGTARNMERRGQYERLWPEAIVVYMQGLPTRGRTDPEGKRNGWQKNPGELGDRDLKFFDAVLTKLSKDLALDRRRVFVTGHSNGGRMSYLLWSKRSDIVAAAAVSGSPGRGLIAGTPPRSILVIAGEKDDVAPFAGQAQSIADLRALFGITSGKAAEKLGPVEIEKGKNGVELGTWVYSGGHQPPAGAPAAIVSFLKRQAVQ